MSDLYMVREKIVAECLVQLRDQRVHNNFAGYLCIKRTSARDQSIVDLRVNFKEFFDTYLEMPGAPSSQKPYLQPFVPSEPNPDNAWFNRNVAGSYAPSSIRSGQPFSQVVSVNGRSRDARYSLKERHWELALTHLLFGQQLPVVPLAIFLYRDYGFNMEYPDVGVVVSVFREEFGYSIQNEQNELEFRYLYLDDSSAIDSSDWFELISAHSRE